MKKNLIFFFSLLILLSASSSVIFWRLKSGKKGALSKRSYLIQEQLKTFYPIRENQRFALLILAKNAAPFCEKQLESIFNQTYPHYKVIYLDNGSTDQTADKVLAFCNSKNLEEKLMLISHSQDRPDMELIYTAVQTLNPQEIVLFLDGHDWLLHEDVLSHLNSAYANPEVWLTQSRSIHHPDYQKIGGKSLLLTEKECRKKRAVSLDSLFSFPAAYFKKIHLEDFLLDSEFIEENVLETFLYPLFEMGPEHVLFLDEVMLVKNDKKPFEICKERLDQIAKFKSHICSLKPYDHLSYLDFRSTPSPLYSHKGDILLFSKDSPLQLYACLESLYLNVKGINEVYVLYQSYDREVERAYLNLKSEFPGVQFRQICDYPGKDFKTLFGETVKNRREGSFYLLIADDHHLFDQTLDLQLCVEALEKVYLDRLFLTKDRNEYHSPSRRIFDVENGIYAFQVDKERDRESPYMCIYRKRAIEERLRVCKNTPDSNFKQPWEKLLPSQFIALLHRDCKIVPIRFDEEPTLNQKKQWIRKFIEGYKIDVPTLLCRAGTISTDYPLVKREKRRVVRPSRETQGAF